MTSPGVPVTEASIVTTLRSPESKSPRAKVASTRGLHTPQLTMPAGRTFVDRKEIPSPGEIGHFRREDSISAPSITLHYEPESCV